MKYLRYFKTTNAYDSATLESPNVSYIEDSGRIQYIPKAHNSVITYYATDKLVSYTIDDGYGYQETIHELDETSFNCNILSHTFANGVGTIVFDGVLTRIGYGAFSSLKVTSIHLPDGLLELRNPFINCSNLSEIVCYSKTAPVLEKYQYSQSDIGVVKYPAGSDYSSWEGYYEERPDYTGYGESERVWVNNFPIGWTFEEI